MATVRPKMDGLKRLEVLRLYCDYVEEHLRNVGKAWVILQEACVHEKQVWNDVDFWHTHALIEQHDKSKMDAAEFTAYAEWFYGSFGKEYDIYDDGGEGEEQHRAAKAAFDAAWEHHKAHNQHHWQNWTQAGERFPGETACHLMCMVADWMAMGMKFGDTAEEYYEREKAKIHLPEWAVDCLQRIFAALRKANVKHDERP
jgi:hypothetical protein